MNSTVKIGIALALFLVVSIACAQDVEYFVVVHTPANLSVSVDAPSLVSLDDNFVVTANVSNSGTENADEVVAQLIFIDEYNDIEDSRSAFIYVHPEQEIGNLEGEMLRMSPGILAPKNRKKILATIALL